MALPPTPTADRVLKFIGVFLIFVGIAALGSCAYDLVIFVTTHKDPNTSMTETILAGIPIVYIGWAPRVGVAVMAFGIGRRMFRKQFHSGDNGPPPDARS